MNQLTQANGGGAMAQQSISLAQPGPVLAPAPAAPMTAAAQLSSVSPEEKKAIAAEITAAVPGATQADIDEAVIAYQKQNEAAGINSAQAKAALTTPPAAPAKKEVKKEAPKPKASIAPTPIKKIAPKPEIIDEPKEKQEKPKQDLAVMPTNGSISDIEAYVAKA